MVLGSLLDINNKNSKSPKEKLEDRVERLQEDLKQAKTALAALEGTDDIDTATDDDNDSSSQQERAGIQQPPLSKSGYLYKWNDRLIGWSGTKWGLRFCVISQGKLSYYGRHEEKAPRYELSLRGCAVQDDGHKPNPRYAYKRGKDTDPPPLNEPGAYFFLFSIYQLDNNNTTSSVPLLRFSTPSRAEKLAWIKLIAETCAYCETPAFYQAEQERRLQQEQNALQLRIMETSMPEAKPGTLPPLVFAPHRQTVRRRPSFSRTPSAKDFQKIKKKSSEKSYPPSKPMHRKSEPSYLSFEAPRQNYRGLFNLGILVLIVSNMRLLVISVKSHGFVFHKILGQFRELQHLRRDPWEEFPFVSGFLLQFVFITIATLLEYGLSRQKKSGALFSRIGMFLHYINAYASIIIPIYIVWNHIHQPATGAILLLHATITWMKLISYVLANQDYRESNTNDDLAIVEDLETDQIQYPQNITIPNMLYFWFCPSLTYQIAYPRSPRVRLWKVTGILMRMVVCVTLFTLVAAQAVNPVLDSLVADLQRNNGQYNIGMIADYWLKLAIANTYLWLLMFYFYFHLYLNLFAEILRFGDRVFYKDWWNSGEVSAYWRLWNMPVHYWLVRHVYFPCMRLKLSKNTSTFLVFLLSAVVHELLVSVPFHMIRPWSFIGMMLQIPLVGVTKYLFRKYPGSSVGNMIFWLSFCVVGQPMAVLLYTVDYQFARSCAEGGVCLAR